jgi:arylsulfatase A-like enzyme
MFTSKVLPYEESIHVPLFISGPDIKPGRSDELVLNIDIFPTILDIIEQDIPKKVHGKSLLPLLEGQNNLEWRDKFLYEAPISQLGSWPLWAIRTKKWKYIETHHINNQDSIAFKELYNLHSDPYEMENLAEDNKHQKLRNKFSRQIDSLKKLYNN